MKCKTILTFLFFQGQPCLLMALLFFCLSATRTSGCFYLLFGALILLLKETSRISVFSTLYLFRRFLQKSTSGFFLVCYIFLVFICSLLGLASNQTLMGVAFSSFRPSAFHILLSAISFISVFFCIKFVGSLSSLVPASFSVARKVVNVLLVWLFCAYAFSGLTLAGSAHEPASNLRPSEGLYVASFVLYYYVRVFSRINFLRMSKWRESLSDILPVFLALLVVAFFGGIGTWFVLLLSLLRSFSCFDCNPSPSGFIWAKHRFILLRMLPFALIVVFFLWEPLRYLVVKYAVYIIGFSETPRFSYLSSFADYVLQSPPILLGASSASWNDVLSHNTFLDMSTRYGVLPAVCFAISILSSFFGMFRLALHPDCFLRPVDLAGLVFFFCYLSIQPVPISDSYAYVLSVFLLSLTSVFCTFLRADPSIRFAE